MSISLTVDDVDLASFNFDKKEFDGDDHTHTVKSGPRRMIRLLVTDAEEVTAVDAVVSTAKLAVCKLDKALFLL
jgi:hypothetical protein